MHYAFATSVIAASFPLLVPRSNKIPPRNYYLVAITLLLSATLPIILASARLGATKCERRPMAFCGLAPNSAPCSPECQEHRQIVPEYDVLAVEWRRYQGRSFGGATIQARVRPENRSGDFLDYFLPKCRNACRRTQCLRT